MTISANGYKVNNVPAYAMNYEYIVARECDDAMWFWGAYHTMKEADRVAQEVRGISIPLNK